MSELVIEDGVKPIEFSEYSHYSSEEPDVVGLPHVYSVVQSGVYRNRIEALRDMLEREGVDAYREQKKHLAAWTFAARFDNRRHRSCPMALSGYICLDFDHLADAEGVLVLAEDDPNVLVAFRSPSREGVKVIVRLDPMPDLIYEYDADGELIEDRVDAEYQFAYQFVEGYYARKWGLSLEERDPKTKDVVRMCFVSYDPDAVYNPHAKPFDWTLVRGMPSEQALELANATRGHRNLVGALVFAIKRLHGWDDAWRGRVLELYSWACGRQCGLKDYDSVIDEAVASADKKGGGSACLLAIVLVCLLRFG